MGLLSKFDINTDLSRFFLGGLIILLIFSVLLTWVSPKGKGKGKRGKVDDRVVSWDGELID